MNFETPGLAPPQLVGEVADAKRLTEGSDDAERPLRLGLRPIHLPIKMGRSFKVQKKAPVSRGPVRETAL